MNRRFAWDAASIPYTDRVLAVGWFGSIDQTCACAGCTSVSGSPDVRIRRSGACASG